MGQLVKSHWARLLTLVAATCHVAASIECFIWPKVFWDFTTAHFDHSVQPVPILQICNLLMALVGFAWEWPLPVISKTRWHHSIELRLLAYPASGILEVLMYQGSNASLFYLIAVVVWIWAYWEGERVCAIPWTVPENTNSR